MSLSPFNANVGALVKNQTPDLLHTLNDHNHWAFFNNFISTYWGSLFFAPFSMCYISLSRAFISFLILPLSHFPTFEPVILGQHPRILASKSLVVGAIEIKNIWECELLWVSFLCPFSTCYTFSHTRFHSIPYPPFEPPSHLRACHITTTPSDTGLQSHLLSRNRN